MLKFGRSSRLERKKDYKGANTPFVWIFNEDLGLGNSQRVTDIEAYVVNKLQCMHKIRWFSGDEYFLLIPMNKRRLPWWGDNFEVVQTLISTLVIEAKTVYP